jgi:hypothetical protein
LLNVIRYCSFRVENVPDCGLRIYNY